MVTLSIFFQIQHLYSFLKKKTVPVCSLRYSPCHATLAAKLHSLTQTQLFCV